MKKSAEIVGMLLMGIKEGKELGRVCELVIDVAAKNVRFLVVDCGCGCFGYKVIGLESVKGIGADYVIVSSIDGVEDLWRNNEALELGYSSKFLIGSRVIGCDGNIIGTVNEFSIDERTGDLVEFELADGKGVISAQQVVTLTRSQLFVDAGQSQKSGMTAEDSKAELEESQFESEQRRYLLGRTVNTKITDDNGKEIIQAGAVLTDALIDLAKQANRLVDLTLSVD